jgi:hypothetical protein
MRHAHDRLRGGPVAVVLAAFAAVMIGGTGPAQACRCFPREAGREMIPASGTTGFPTDGQVRVFFNGFPPALRQRLGEEYRLRDAAGTLVPIAASTQGTMLTLAPRSRLRPNARYTVERVFGYEAGSRLSDQERGLIAYRGERQSRGPSTGTNAGPVARLWFPDGWFETGAGAERRRSEAPALQEAHVSLDQSNCGPGPGVLVRYTAPGLLDTDVVALERRGAGIVRLYPRIREFDDQHYSARLDNSRCDPNSEVVSTTQPFEFRLLTVTASGQRVAPAAWTAAQVEGKTFGQPATSASVASGAFWGLTTSGRDGVEQWFSRPAREPPTLEEPPGPAGCTWGLESQGPVALETRSTRKAGWAWEPIAASWRSGALLIAGGIAESSGSGQLVRWRAGSVTTGVTLPGQLQGSRVMFGDVDLVAAMADRSAPTPTLPERLIATRLSLDGRPAWRRTFGQSGYNSHAILARGSRRTLLCWDQSEPGKATENRLLCTVLTSSDGRTVRAPFYLRADSGANLGHSDAIVNSALAVDGGFLVAWRPGNGLFYARPGASLTRIDDNGRLLDTVVLGDADPRFLDLARTRSAVVVAWDGARTGVELAWLGPDGRPRNGVRPRPVAVSAGSGNGAFWPQLATHGDLVATTWRVPDTKAAVLVATADASSAVSPALNVGAGLPSSESVITTHDDGFTVIYEGRDYPQFENLRCRTKEPAVSRLGAPQRVVTTP